MKSKLVMFLTLVAMFLFGAILVPVNAQEAPATTTLEEVTADSASFYGSEVTLEGVAETFLNVNMFVLAEGAALDDDRVLVINNSGQPFSPDVVAGERVLVTGIVHPARSQYKEEGMGMETTPDAAIAPTVDPDLIATPDTAMEATPEGGVDMTTPDAAMEPTLEGADMTTPDAAMTTPDTALEATPEGGMDMTTPDAAIEPTMDTAMATPVGSDMMPRIDALNFYYTYPQDLLDGYNDYTIIEVTRVETVTLQPDTE